MRELLERWVAVARHSIPSDLLNDTDAALRGEDKSKAGWYDVLGLFKRGEKEL